MVAQSFGGFTAPLVANTGYEEARREQEQGGGPAPGEVALFYHDVPPDLVAEALLG